MSATAHGTRHAYNRHGCRCAPCRAANADYEHARRNYEAIVIRSLARPGPWITQAACAGMDSNRWFPTRYEHADPEALAVCHACPVQLACLNWAMRNHERFGIWGGLTERQRRRLAQKRKAAA